MVDLNLLFMLLYSYLPNQTSSLFFDAATHPLYRIVALKPSRSWTREPTSSISMNENIFETMNNYLPLKT